MKKLIALLLALVMVLSLMACTAKEEPEKEEEKPADSEQKPAEDKKEEDKKEEEKEEEEAPADEYVPGSLPLTTEEKTITIGLQQNQNTENYDTNDYTLWLEEQTGINLEFVYFSNDKTEAQTQLALMVSGGQKLPDILWGVTLDLATVNEYGESEYFLDLNPYFEEYGYYWTAAFEQLSPALQKRVMTGGQNMTNGALYAFPSVQVPVARAMMYFVTVNAEWLEAVGEEIPTTIDEFRTVLEKFAEEDPNGNGIKDEIPALTHEGYYSDLIQFLINAFVYCNDDYFFNVTDGKIWAPYDTDEYREALIWLNGLYDDGLLSPLCFTLGDDSNAEMMKIYTPSDQVALAGVVGAWPSLTMERENPVAYEYAAVAPLEDATGKGGYAIYRPETVNYYTFITADAEDPVLAFRLLDFMCCDDSWLFQRYGIYGEHWTDAEEGAVSQVGTPAAITLLDSTVYQQQNNVNWHNIHANIVRYDAKAFSYVAEETWTSKVTALSNASLAAYASKPCPEELIFTQIFTAEENELVSEVSQMLKDYIKEQRALFITGVLDPEDDEAWQTYLDALESQGYYDYIAASQSAYDRTAQ